MKQEKGEISRREWFEEESNNVCLLPFFSFQFPLHNNRASHECDGAIDCRNISGSDRPEINVTSSPYRSIIPHCWTIIMSVQTVTKENILKKKVKKGTRRFVYCQNHHKYIHMWKAKKKKSMAQHYCWRWGLRPRRNKKIILGTSSVLTSIHST